MRPLVLALLMAPGLAGAQTITVGAHGGVNVASTEGATTTVKPVAGASLDVDLFGQIALRVEAEYSEAGAHLDAGSSAAAPGPLDYDVGYLAIPINLKYDLLHGTFPTYLFAGTTVGALLFATEHQGGMTSDVKGALRPIDVTLDLGGGIGYRFSPSMAVGCDVRWSIGLLDDKRDDALATDSWKTRDVKVVLGVTYTINPLAPSAPSAPAGMPGY